MRLTDYRAKDKDILRLMRLVAETTKNSIYLVAQAWLERGIESFKNFGDLLAGADRELTASQGRFLSMATLSIPLRYNPKGAAIMTIKLKSSELGCGVPYRLTYSGQVFASSETRSLLADYIRAYKASVEQVVLYFSEVIRRGEGDELTAYVLIGPSKVPRHIADTEVWHEVMGKESDYVTLKKGGDLKAIYTIAGYEVKTRVGKSLADFAKQFNLGISDLNLEKVEALFGFSPKLGIRDTVAAASFRILRSFLSSATNARQIIADRQSVFAWLPCCTLLTRAAP